MTKLRLHAQSDEVVVAEGPVVAIGGSDIADLKRSAEATPRQRMRICTHPSVDDPLHEMMIVHAHRTYVRPHKHLGKSESMHVLEGSADLVFFDDDGTVDDVVRLGPYGSDARFYVRSDEPLFHTLLIDSPVFVFHEVTTGPFRRDDTVFAPWSPEESDTAACAAFLDRLARIVGNGDA